MGENTAWGAVITQCWYGAKRYAVFELGRNKNNDMDNKDGVAIAIKKLFL